YLFLREFSLQDFRGGSVFDQITWGALACVGVVLMIWLYQALKFRNRALALES
ncbi:hypothetical protein LGZ32_004996, partial [Escherichia coli]|nr:hypothetical protein [Escherichia coli]EIJ7291297.1 hypothetical protein [Escherichia coli]